MFVVLCNTPRVFSITSAVSDQTEEKKNMMNELKLCEMIWKIWKKNKLKCEMIGKICKKGNLNSEKIWKIWKKHELNSEKIWKIPYLITIQLASSIFSISFHYPTYFSSIFSKSFH
jgi:hypothetical protein